MSLNPSSAGPRNVSGSVFLVAILITAGVAVAATAGYYTLFPAAVGGPPGPHVTVLDDSDRTVTAPVNATRIVVLAPNVMDLVYRLNLRDRVVGIGCTTGIAGGMLNEYTPNQTTDWNLTPAMCITDFPTLDTETIANLSTQLVLASTLTYASDVATLTDTFHIPVVILAPADLGGIITDVRLLAELFPVVGTTALSLEAHLGAILNNASDLVTSLSYNDTPAPSVLLTYYFYEDGYGAYGQNSFGESLVALAGGNSISSNLTFEYADLNATVVLSDQPNVILYGTSWNDEWIVDGQDPGAWTSSAPYWSQLNGTKIPVDVTLITEPDASMIFYLPWLEHWFYPTIVPAPLA